MHQIKERIEKMKVKLDDVIEALEMTDEMIELLL